MNPWSTRNKTGLAAFKAGRDESAPDSLKGAVPLYPDGLNTLNDLGVLEVGPSRRSDRSLSRSVTRKTPIYRGEVLVYDVAKPVIVEREFVKARGFKMGMNGKRTAKTAETAGIAGKVGGGLNQVGKHLRAFRLFVPDSREVHALITVSSAPAVPTLAS